MELTSRPRLKHLVEICAKDSKIYFFRRPGFAIKLDDVSGFILDVCKMMDGKITVQELKEILSTTHPHESSYLLELLDVLDQEYLIEDVAKLKISSLNTDACARWARNIDFFGAHVRAQENKFLYQEKLLDAKVAILGLGGVGSNVLYNLVGMGIGNITAVDFDKVELSNLNRQIIYDYDDVGLNKSDIVKSKILKFNPSLNLNVLNKKLLSADEIEDIVSNHDLVIGAVDLPRNDIADWLNLACVNKKIPYICGSLDSDVGIYYSVVPGVSGCVECWKRSANEKSTRFQELLKYEGFISANSPNIAIMPFISMVTGLIGAEAVRILSGIWEPLGVDKLTSYSFITGQVTYPEIWKRDNTCPICSAS